MVSFLVCGHHLLIVFCVDAEICLLRLKKADSTCSSDLHNCFSSVAVLKTAGDSLLFSVGTFHSKLCHWQGRCQVQPWRKRWFYRNIFTQKLKRMSEQNQKDENYLLWIIHNLVQKFWKKCICMSLLHSDKWEAFFNDTAEASACCFCWVVHVFRCYWWGKVVQERPAWDQSSLPTTSPETLADSEPQVRQ